MLGLIKATLPGKKAFCKTNHFYMSIKAALLLCQLCTNHNCVAGQTQLFVPSAVLQSKLRCYANFNFLGFQLYANDNYVAGQFNVIPVELGNFLNQETLT